MTETNLNVFDDRELHYYAQQFSAYQQGGTPVGVRDRKLGRELSRKNSPVRKSNASSRTIRRAVERMNKTKAVKPNHNKPQGF